MLCVVKLNTHNICQKPPSNKVKVTLFQKLLADNEEMNLLCENNLTKDLKSKRSVATWQPSHDSPFSYFKLNWSMRGSSFKQIKLSRSLENTENCIEGFVLLASVKSSCSRCLREKSQLFWSHCRQLSFSTSQRVKRTICVQKVILIKNRNFYSVLENKTM